MLDRAANEGAGIDGATAEFIFTEVTYSADNDAELRLLFEVLRALFKLLVRLFETSFRLLEFRGVRLGNKFLLPRKSVYAANGFVNKPLHGFVRGALEQASR